MPPSFTKSVTQERGRTPHNSRRFVKFINFRWPIFPNEGSIPRKIQSVSHITSDSWGPEHRSGEHYRFYVHPPAGISIQHVLSRWVCESILSSLHVYRHLCFLKQGWWGRWCIISLLSPFWPFPGFSLMRAPDDRSLW